MKIEEIKIGSIYWWVNPIDKSKSGFVKVLSIDEDTLPGQSQASISATVATLPSGSDDIRPLFALPRRIARYAVLHFVKRTVEKDSVSYDVYELQANVKGVAICIR